MAALAKSARAGELRTRIYIRRVSKTVNENGVSSPETEESVIGHDAGGNERMYHCKWVNAYGSEVFSAMQMQVQEPATLTMRYSRRIQPDQLIYKVGDPMPYEIISINDVEDRHRWLEVKVCRRRAAR